MKVSQINVVFVYVENIERSKKFYQDTLKFGKPVKDTEHWVEWKMGKGSNFALSKASQRRLEGSVPERGTIKFSLVVEGLEEARKTLHNLGITLYDDIRHVEDFSFLEFQDPDGNVVRLLEWDK